MAYETIPQALALLGGIDTDNPQVIEANSDIVLAARAILADRGEVVPSGRGPTIYEGTTIHIVVTGLPDPGWRVR